MRRRVVVAAAAALLTITGCSADDTGGGDRGDDGRDVAGTDSDEPGDSGDVVAVPGVVTDAGSVAVTTDPARVVAPCDGELCRWSLDGRLVDRVAGGAIVATSGSGLWTDRVEDGVVELVLLDPVGGEEVGAVDAYQVADVQDGPGQGLRDIAVSPDGARVAAVGADGVVRTWADGLSEELVVETDGDAVAAAFSPDGTQLAVASSDAPVTVHDASTGERVGELDAPAQGAVEWSDAGWLATASFALDDAAATTVWDGETREVLATLDLPAYRLDALDDDTLLISVKDDKDVVRWQWREDRVSRYSGASDVPRAVSHTADGRVIAVSPRDGVLAWDADGGRPTTFAKPEE